MKNLIILLLMLPALTYAQSESNNKKSNEPIGDMGIPSPIIAGIHFYHSLSNRKIMPLPPSYWKEDLGVSGKVIGVVIVDSSGTIKYFKIMTTNEKLRKAAEQKIKSIHFNKVPDPPIEEGKFTFVFKTARK